MDTNEKALQIHKENQGKIALQSKVSVKNRDDLSLAYTPGRMWRAPSDCSTGRSA